LFTRINPDSELHASLSKTEIRECPDKSLSVAISDACLALVGFTNFDIGSISASPLLT